MVDDLTCRDYYPFWIIIARLGQAGPVVYRVPAPTADLAQAQIERTGALVYIVAKEVSHRYHDPVDLAAITLLGNRAS